MRSAVSRRTSTLLVAAGFSRNLVLRPEGTRNPGVYPLGYIPLHGRETIDFIYDAVKQGHFVASRTTIEVIHNAYVGVQKLLLNEYAVADDVDGADEYAHADEPSGSSLPGLLALHHRRRELLNRILIARSFWEHADFNDPELNVSFGRQNDFFDNYQWSQTLWKEFKAYAEQWFPVSEHTHLRYGEYMRLIESFYVAKEGVRMSPLLPKSYKLRPAFGVTPPNRTARDPIILYTTWLREFRSALPLNRCLVVRGGCGVAAMATRLCGVPMVRMTDPSPFAIRSAKADAARLGYLFRHMSFVTADMFPPSSIAGGSSPKYKMIFYYPDEHLLQGVYDDDTSETFAPTLSGFEGDLEQFFERAGEHLDDCGVLVVACTNFSSLVRPEKPHPVEYEVRANRRWMVLDYYDRKVSAAGRPTVRADDFALPLAGKLRKSLRCELWILHKTSSLGHFGWMHGVPGAAPPATAVRAWANRSAMAGRRRVLKAQAAMDGSDWGDFKDRMLRALQEQSGDAEDDEAQEMRMAMDPTYPLELAEQSRKAVEANMRSRAEFHELVASEFPTDGSRSPRQAFDSWAARLRLQSSK
jgi:hypothetical protein